MSVLQKETLNLYLNPFFYFLSMIIYVLIRDTSLKAILDSNLSAQCANISLFYKTHGCGGCPRDNTN